jgi:hypothetical protein
MKTSFYLGIMGALILLAGLAIPVVGQAGISPDAPEPGTPEAINAASVRWVKRVIDTQGDVGAHNSIVVDQQSGHIYIGYYDATGGDLRIAQTKAMKAWEACGPGDTWFCKAIDGTGGENVGQYASIDLHPASSRPGIAYFDVSNGALKYAHYGCIFNLCNWQVDTIDDDPLFSAGRYTSLKYDSTGVPYIAYYASHIFLADQLRLAHYVGSGGNCGESSDWQCDMIDEGVGMGQYASLALNTANQKYIAYYQGSTGDLRYAAEAGSGGNCGVGGSFRCFTIDSAGDVGKYAVLNHHPQGGNRIAYYDATNGRLKFAHFVTSGANCGGGLSMKCDSIDTLGVTGDPVGIALAEIEKDRPVIAYYDSDYENGSLKVAQFVGLYGNCGPKIDLPFPLPDEYTWQCDLLDNGYVGYPPALQKVGQYTSIDLNSAGLAYIAYNNADSGDLRLAYQRLNTFLPLLRNSH